MEQSKVLKCLIIGSGPAGYTAAIYAARAGLNPVLYTGNKPGGQLTITTDVENFPGFPDGVQGPELVELFRQQAARFDTELHYENITKVDFSGPIHKAWDESGKEILAHTVIISTGADAKWLGAPGEERLMNRGVSACAVCDGFFFRGMEVAVVGGGDSAAEEATYLAKLCPKVHLIVRKDFLRASKIMAKRVMDNPKIQVHFNTETVEILGEDEVAGVKLYNNATKEEFELPVKGFFIAIGHKPNTDIFSGYIELKEGGYIKTIQGTVKTNVEGVFAAGDVQDDVYRQAITSAGTGCMAALEAEKYLINKGIE
ncbi:MAG: thioredoxin-disulfide reductase [Saprospiraceae bacterium]|nr:thioredoxin-disulfide reductase [Candidatus Parvibacillus calidus]MBX2935952.1 thioredoxin-disulfide reductase [Saprospiraceae bacterium]MBX7179235.1 thioredoxin-disulfide reductase [Saprospiraceae bacterium]MCB0591276.1 thioredoxin-disulfide reductase [Saprospiraceae bacterium]MCC7148264.1 thioredoxin-disulfide reductase [Saprospiraceae bacterium]